MVKRILSIDGGGIKGVFPASFLAALEETNNIRVSDYFDLIVGTSTGGIVALGLGLSFSASDILKFYETHGPDIFKGNQFLKALRHLGLSKYTQAPLKYALTKTFGDSILGDCKSRLVIPSFNLQTGEVHLYKTSHHPRFATDYKDSVVDVALATSAAPTYFPVHTTSTGIPLTDGGVWANNPIGIAAVEGIGILEWPREQIRILSISCTAEPFEATKRGGKFKWASQISDVFLASQSSASMGMAQHLVGHDNVVRINPIVPKKKFGLDSVGEFSLLKGLGITEARKANQKIKDFFLKEKVEPFTPYHS